jgi:L-ascorbate metabolism protein UlaG (beta-lactamase superfamily)
VLSLTYVGGPTALLEYGGIRFLLDPTFDPPGEYPIGPRRLTKTQPPALAATELGRVDAVLLSHHQHPDNLDRAGRALLAEVPLVLSTASAAARVDGPAQPLAAWQSLELPGSGPEPVRVTGVPAQHGPDGSERLVGEVTGFVLAVGGAPALYVSGDNASLRVVGEIGERLGPFGAVVLNAGAARTALAGGAPLTLTSEDAAAAVELLGRPPALLLHFEGWAHFSEGADELRAAFARRGLGELLHLPEAGQTIAV